ncbi:MAG: tRNA (guanosine(37)-N1)-methyltransferase TrmD [Steroidobacteraceae bacterium]|nr:tRNA (guanosine(37)-N1)-methyltransferase TrmD [Steroidobacteraceae bacterium]MDW8258768.1 tRNA (guanosine(37)-N1)-methyltransferase TrmD [Gammaproteobacteria bacterium]
MRPFSIEVVTLFPALIADAVRYGVIGRALDRGVVAVGCEDPRRHAHDIHRTVDDRPYGGGPGMVGKPEVWAAAIDAAARRVPAGSPRIYLTAQGARFDDRIASELAALDGIVLVAGRYEGLDERVVESRIDRELSIGDYVLSGGEFAALVIIDAVLRRRPGVLNNAESARDESFAMGLLEWPQYTRPAVWEGREVPAVLQSGDHAAIAQWRRSQALQRTRARRPDLLQRSFLEESSDG